MSLSGVNHLPIEYISLDITVPLGLMILGLFQFFLNIILDWDTKIYSFFLESNKSSSATGAKDTKGHLKNLLQVKGEEKKNEDLELTSNKRTINTKEYCDDSIIYRQEVEVVMKSLGLFCRPESGKLQERFDCNDLSNLFEEKEPTLEEVKEAFDVFDENKDGFIDAEDLQKLLSALGLKEGSELENCRKMIRVFDKNGDERIDLHEFLKFMESNFC